VTARQRTADIDPLFFCRLRDTIGLSVSERAPVPERDLIFDLGMFDGSDTAFYLAKGFRVVAVEARPDLCRAARARFAGELRGGQLTIVERAIWSTADERLPFYVRSGWSSAFRQSAERDGEASEIIEVRTTTLRRLISEFGVPHFLKCDLEGAEDIVIDELPDLPEKPSFLSVEDPTGDGASRLAAVGYDRFQMVNQGHLRLYRPPRPALEGRYVSTTFDGRCSGLFGFELNSAHWVDNDRLQRQMRLWRSLRERTVNPVVAFATKRWGKLTRRGWLIPSGWSDIHATTAATLRAA
jgi:FkbM family methyltransferase